ncbi:MAG: hypothetical protein U9Q73_02625 [Nanoarchaeota archaeon]|nr:hypothetical protein [Nanoarchaeota archaeon]
MKAKKLFIEKVEEKNLTELTEEEFNSFIKSSKVESVYKIEKMISTIPYAKSGGDGCPWGVSEGDVKWERELQLDRHLEGIVRRYPDANAYIPFKHVFYKNSEKKLIDRERAYHEISWENTVYHILPLKIDKSRICSKQNDRECKED